MQLIEVMVDQISLQVISLPGHSTEQVGVAFGNTLFVGDAFFTPEILDTHHIPFYTDVQAGLTTLSVLKTQITPFKHIVAGHGELYTSKVRSARFSRITTCCGKGCNKCLRLLPV